MLIMNLANEAIRFVTKTRTPKGCLELLKLISSVCNIAPGAFDLSPVLVHYFTLNGKLLAVRSEGANVC